MRRDRTELVSREHEEHIGGHLAEHLVQPGVLEHHGHLQQVDDDPRKVDVAHDHDVELAEELQLAQIDCRLAIGCRGFVQMSDGPDDRE